MYEEEENRWRCSFRSDGKWINVNELLQAFSQASQTKGKPSVIIANTIKGFGSPVMENKADWHHKVPTREEYDRIVSDFAAGKEAALHE